MFGCLTGYLTTSTVRTFVFYPLMARTRPDSGHGPPSVVPPYGTAFVGSDPEEVEALMTTVAAAVRARARRPVPTLVEKESCVVPTVITRTRLGRASVGACRRAAA